jgi:hypothetical protein
MMNETTNMAAEYVASYLFIQAAKNSNPTNAVSIAKNAKRKNIGCRGLIVDIVNASLRKF